MEEEDHQDRQEAIIITETIASSSPEATTDPAESPPRNLGEVEEILRYNFKDRRILKEALTHPSYDYNPKDDNHNIDAETNKFSSERLEYLGDAVLNFLVTKEEFFSYPNLPSGQLTRLRSANVDTEKLARVAVKHGLYCYMLHKRPLLEEQINEFIKETLEYPVHSNGQIDVPKCLADLVESIIGAIFIDSNSDIDIVWKVFRPLLEPIINKETLKTHPVTELNEVCQKHNKELKYSDDSWEDSMKVKYLVDGKVIGKGKGPNKNIARKRAGLDALKDIQTILSVKEASTSQDIVN